MQQHVTSKFRGDEIFEVNGETQRLWIEILNKFYNKPIKILKNTQSSNKHGRCRN